MKPKLFIPQPAGAHLPTQPPTPPLTAHTCGGKNSSPPMEKFFPAAVTDRQGDKGGIRQRSHFERKVGKVSLLLHGGIPEEKMEEAERGAAGKGLELFFESPPSSLLSSPALDFTYGREL